MATCPDCGATVDFCRVEGLNERVVLDRVPSITGPDRYRVKDFDNLIYEPVAPTNQVSAYPAHDSTCAVKFRDG